MFQTYEPMHFPKGFVTLKSCINNLTGPPIDQEVHIPNNKLAASLRDKVVIRGYLYGFDNKQETKVRWLFNGAPLIIIRDSNLEESSRFDFEHSLIIKSVRNSYYGTYTLEAQSGSRVSKDTVKVQRSSKHF